MPKFKKEVNQNFVFYPKSSIRGKFVNKPTSENKNVFCGLKRFG